MNVGSGLPGVLGAIAALVVGFASQMAQVSLPAFVMRVVSAFVVFAAFGVILRFILAEGAARAELQQVEALQEILSEVRPGATVAELLEAHEGSEKE
jgi:hypothetical protein